MEEINVNLARMAAYSALSQCYYFPREDIPALFENSEFLEQKTLLKTVGIDLPCLINNFKTIESDRLLSLQKEYTRLFITSMDKIPAPPYGSIYLDPEGFIWGDSTREVVKLYCQAGLRISEDFKDLPDHFAVELEFMFYLLREQVHLAADESETVESTGNDEHPIDKETLLNIEEIFLKKHLFKWGFRFLKKISAESSHPFYCALAEITDSFLSYETNRLK